MMLTDNHHLTESADEVLDKAEAFLRSRRLGVAPPSDDDVPVLTDIVSETAAFLEISAPPDAEAAIPEAASLSAEPAPHEDMAPEAPPTEIIEPAQPFVPEDWPEAAYLPELEPAGVDQLEFELPEAAQDIPVLQEVVAAPSPAAEQPAPAEALLAPPVKPEATPAMLEAFEFGVTSAKAPAAMAAEAPPPPPGLSEEAVAARVAEALAHQRQLTTLLLEEWLNFDLKTIIQQEFEHANERIVRRSLQEIHALLDAQQEAEKKP